MSFTAKWSSGECRVCGDDILKGQEVEFDDERNLLHVICPDSTRLGKPRPVCPSCFIELPLIGKCLECFPDD